MRSSLHWTVLAACLGAACSEAAEDPGPFSIDGWIGQCEVRCEQESSCDPEELLFYHGDLDNCLYDCGYNLDRDENLQFIEETPDACVEALYAQVTCVFHLGCDDFDAWEDQGEGAPCAEESAAAACEGIDAAELLHDCGWPEDHDVSF